MKMTSKKALTLFSLCVSLGTGLAAGCSQTTLDLLGRSFIPVNMTPEQVTQTVYQQVITPGYGDFLVAAQELDLAAGQWKQNPDSASARETTQAAWKKASTAWVETEAYQFGPATEQRIRQNISFWPRRLNHLEGVLTGSDPVNVNKMGTSRKGLPAVEFLAFGQAETLSQRNERGERGRTYLKALTADLVQQAERLQTAWQGDYGQNFLTSANAQNMQLNQWVLVLENIKNKRLGDPAGLLGTTLGTEGLEAPDSDYSLELIEAALKGFEKSYRLEGFQIQNAPQTSEYLVALGHRPVQEKVAAQLVQVKQDLEALRPSLKQALKNNPEAVKTSFESVKTLLRYVKVDMANALNQTVNFTDNDGD